MPIKSNKYTFNGVNYYTTTNSKTIVGVNE